MLCLLIYTRLALGVANRAKTTKPAVGVMNIMQDLCVVVQFDEFGGLTSLETALSWRASSLHLELTGRVDQNRHVIQIISRMLIGTHIPHG